MPTTVKNTESCHSKIFKRKKIITLHYKEFIHENQITITFLKTPFHFILLHNHPAPPFSLQDDHHNFSPALLEIIYRPLFASPAHEIRITAEHFSTLHVHYKFRFTLQWFLIFFFSGIHFTVREFCHSYVYPFLTIQK